MRTAMIVSLVLLCGLAWPQTQNDKKQNGNAAPSEQSAAPAPTATNDANYVIGADDVLRIDVWKEPELSTASVPVRPDGKISLPLLNDVQAAGNTPTQLGEQITQKLKKFVEDPRVTVVVTQINSKKVFILGQVNHPGTFSLLPDMTVLQALSTAGGFSQYANLSKIYVLRTENGAASKIPFNYKEVVKGEKQNQNIVLKPGDTIVVP